MWYVRSGFSTCPGGREIQIVFFGSSACMNPCVRSTPKAFHFVREVALVFRYLLPLHDEAHLESLNLHFVLSRRGTLDFIVETGGDDLVPMGSSLLLSFVRQPRPNKPVISLPCSSFPVRASRSLRITAPLSFGRAQSGRSMTNHAAPCSAAQISSKPSKTCPEKSST